MKTLRVEIDEEKDLPVLKEVLAQLGLRFELETDEYAVLTDFERVSLNQGLRDLDAGKVHSNELARVRIDKKIAEMRMKYAGQ